MADIEFRPRMFRLVRDDKRDVDVEVRLELVVMFGVIMLLEEVILEVDVSGSVVTGFGSSGI